MPSTTFLDAKYDLWRIFAARDPEVRRFVPPFNTSALATDTTHIQDASLIPGTVHANRYDGREIEIVEAGGAAVGEVSTVINGGLAPATGIVEVLPAFSAAVHDATDYIMWPKGLTRALAEDALNEVLRHTEGPHLWVPSMVPDGNFDAEAVTNWAAVGSPDTREWYTTLQANVLLGPGAVHILEATDTGVGVTSDAFHVTEGEQLLVSVVGSFAAGQVALYNATAAANLKAVSVSEALATEVRFSESVPADMETAQVRILNTAVPSEIFISAPVVVQSFADRAYACPSWLTGPNMVRGAVHLPIGFPSEAADSYIALSEGQRSAPMPDFMQAGRFLTPTRVQFAADSRGPLGLICVRPFAEMSADTDTTNCDREYLTSKAAANLLEDMGDEKAARKYARRAAAAADRASYGGGHELRFEEAPRVTV